MLIFNLRKQWYEKIRAGEKKIEYREENPYWTKRLLNAFMRDNTLNSEKNKDLCTSVKWYRNTDDFDAADDAWYSECEVGLLVSIPCVLRLGYTKRFITAKIVKVEWLKTGKDTDLAIDAPVYAIHLANVREEAV